MGMLDDDVLLESATQAARMPVEPVAPAPPSNFKASVWAQPIRGLAAAIGETAAGAAEAATAFYRGNMEMAYASPERRRQMDRQGVSVSGETAFSRDLREVSRGYRPDPVTAGFAENAVFSVAKGLSKAIGSSLVAGPIGGAVSFGANEGATAFDDLQRKGVDDKTATEAALLAGAAGAAGLLLPIGASTNLGTLGLYAVGGPGAFAAQAAATREILKNADYAEVAAEYDPLDPAGLALSAIIPLPFVAMHVRGLGRAGATSREAMDAAMAHNLTIQQDARAASPLPVEPIDTPPRPVEAEAVKPAAAETAQTDSVIARTVDVEALQPDLPARVGDDGVPVTAKAELERIRTEAREGTDSELGAMDADLLQVASTCALSLGLG